MGKTSVGAGLRPISRAEFERLQDAVKRLTDMVQVVLPTIQRISRDHDLALLALKRMARVQADVETLRKQVSELQLELGGELDHTERLARVAARRTTDAFTRKR
jgi:hypothetical protein